VSLFFQLAKNLVLPSSPKEDPAAPFCMERIMYLGAAVMERRKKYKNL
jgi:hypothetical protein